MFSEERISDLIVTEVQDSITPLADAFVGLEETVNQGFDQDDNRASYLLQRHEALHRKVDEILTVVGRLSETVAASSTSLPNPRDSQRIIDGITPTLQQAVSTTILQQVSDQVQRVMTEFLQRSTFDIIDIWQ